MPPNITNVKQKQCKAESDNVDHNFVYSGIFSIGVLYCVVTDR